MFPETKSGETSGLSENKTNWDHTLSVYCLPHQAVIRKDAETTKLKIVCNASVKETKNGTSLNECYTPGHL